MAPGLHVSCFARFVASASSCSLPVPLTASTRVFLRMRQCSRPYLAPMDYCSTQTSSTSTMPRKPNPDACLDRLPAELRNRILLDIVNPSPALDTPTEQTSIDIANPIPPTKPSSAASPSTSNSSTSCESYSTVTTISSSRPSQHLSRSRTTSPTAAGKAAWVQQQSVNAS